MQEIKEKMVGGNGKKKRERNEPATTNEFVLQERSPMTLIGFRFSQKIKIMGGKVESETQSFTQPRNRSVTP